MALHISIEIQRAKNLHKFRSIVYFGIAIGNFAISIPLAKKYGEIGSAVGTGIAVLLGNVVIMNIYNHIKVKLDIIYFWKQLSRMIIPVTILTVMCGFVIKNIDFSGFKMLSLGIFGYALVFLIVMWIFAFNDYEKDLFKGLLRKIKIIKLK